MATTAIETFLHRLREFGPVDHAGATDGDLLECFVTRRDGAAFAALVRRHGPMVLGVCRRVLRNEADAEDTFQATFLVLVRKAATIRPRGMVGNWLYGVAHSTALKARAMNARRAAREREAVARPKPEGGGEAPEQLLAALDRALASLPDRYRAAVVLCDLEGKTIREAARQLGCPQGTAWSWLSRGRNLLSVRLARHGPAVSGGAIAAAIAGDAAAGVPRQLVCSTVQAARLLAAGQVAGGVVSANTVAIVERVMTAMFLSKLKIAVCASLAVLGFGVGTGRLMLPASAGGPAAASPGQPDDLPDRAHRAAAELAQAKAALEQAEANLAVARAQVARKEAEYRDARQGTPRPGDQAKSAARASAVADRFEFRVPVEIGATETRDGGRIEILEVWGTRPKIEIGGQYLVRGRYTMPAHERGTLYFHETSTGNWDNSGPDFDLQHAKVRTGQGEFTLVHGMGGPGYFHLHLIAENRGQYTTLANVYFGTGNNVLRKKNW